MYFCISPPWHPATPSHYMAWPEPALFFVASTTTLSAFLSAGQCTFLLLWVCARNSFCATVLARYFRLGGRPPGGRNLWRTFDVPTHGTICRSGGRQNLLHDGRSLVNVPRLLLSNFYLVDQGFLFSRLLKQFLLG